jgi:hypothetical protein
LKIVIFIIVIKIKSSVGEILLKKLLLWQENLILSHLILDQIQSS